MRRKEIQFRLKHGVLTGRHNDMEFWIYVDQELEATGALAHYVVIAPNSSDMGKRRVNTGGHQYFSLDGAKAFCQKIAAGEIDLDGLQATYDAEDAAKVQAMVRKVTEQAKKFHARLDAMGLKYTDLLELEVLAHSLGDMGHNILLGYERGEGWPNGT